MILDWGTKVLQAAQCEEKKRIEKSDGLWEVRGGRTGPLRRQQGLREGLEAGDLTPGL